MKPNLKNTTICIADCKNYGEAISAMRKSLYQMDFARAILFSDINAYNPKFPFEIIKIDKISSKEEYSRFIMKELWKHINTDYVLIIQHDGYVLSGNAWNDEFFEYDVVAPAWLYTDGRNCGCGGFTLRSRRLMEILGTDDNIEITEVEDDNTGRLYRHYLEKKYDIKFAPDDVCDRFAFELREPMCETVGFHSNFHKPYKPTVVVKRDGALGDIIATEPLLEYYHNKGYNVAIDMPVHLCMFFGTHHFPIKHVSQLDGRITPKVIDLNMSYEKNPKELHLQSYYDTAGIPDGDIKNPRLKFPISAENKLFKKYCVLHLDKRDQPYRNQYGVNWGYVVMVLKENGYDVIQVGRYEHDPIPGVLEMKTPTTHFLLMVIAGADLFIGIDSGPAAMAVAMNVKSAIFFGSVDPKVIHPDLSNVTVIEHEKVCDTPKCWGNSVGTTGQPCVVNETAPPCTQYTTEMVIDAVKKMVAE